MIESWINDHPWMTFILGMMSLLTLNTFFVSLGGGYKKFPPASGVAQVNEEDEEELLQD